jgi:hypothetical protein
VLKEDEGLASEKDRKYAFLEFSEFEWFLLFLNVFFCQEKGEETEEVEG